MTTLLLLLDLTRTTRGVDATLNSLRAQRGVEWRLLILYADVEGERTAERLAAFDSRCAGRRVGSGTGVCQWARVVEQGESELLSFVAPGDQYAEDALAALSGALAADPQAQWTLGRWTGSRYADWWFDPALRESGAAMLLLGAVPPDVAVLGRTSFWKDISQERSGVLAHSHRAAAFFAMALESPPLRVAEASVVPAGPAAIMDAERLMGLVATVAGEDAREIARVVADMARIAAGLVITRELLLEAGEKWREGFGAPEPGADPALWWRSTMHFNSTLIALRGREVWIWGAGGRGREALRWFSARGIRVHGFLDSNASRAGEAIEGLPVRHAPAMLGEIGPPGADAPLIVVASMYFAEISETLSQSGWREGEHFAAFTASNAGSVAR